MGCEIDGTLNEKYTFPLLDTITLETEPYNARLNTAYSPSFMPLTASFASLHTLFEFGDEAMVLTMPDNRLEVELAA